MPIIQINMMQGRSDQQKKRLVERVTDAVVEAIDAPRENVRILIHEMGPYDFAVAGVPAAEREPADKPVVNGNGAAGDSREVRA